MKKHLLSLFAILIIATNIQAQIPTNGLVAWYPFTSNTLDSSGNNNHGTNNSATLTTDRFGKANSAYSFDGVSNHISIYHSILSANPCDSNWSISFWFNTNKQFDSLYNPSMFSNVDSAAGGLNPFGLYAPGWAALNEHHLFGYWWHKTGIFTIDSVYKKNYWYHLVYTYNSSNNTMKVYLNGKNNSGRIFDLSATSGSARNLGSWFVGSIGKGNYFNGKLDDIRVYNRGIDSSEVQALYHENGYTTSATSITFFNPTSASTNTTVTIKGTSFTGATAVSFGGTSAKSFTVVNDSTITAIVGTGVSGNVTVVTPNGTANLGGFVYNSTLIPNNGLVAWYPFTSNALDSSGSNNHGTNNGATLTIDRFGKANSAYSFDLGQYISTNYIGILGNNERSLSIWFYVSQNSQGRMIGYGNPGSPGGGFNLFINSKHQIVLDISNSNIIFSDTPTLNKWHHLIVSYSGQVGKTISACKFYLDNKLLTKVLSSYNPGQYLSTQKLVSLNFGGSLPSTTIEQFNGSLDDIRIYNRALDNTEIQALYNEGGWNTLLPIQLQQLNATALANSISLQWQTVTATNTDYFVVERSTNGLSFTSIGKVDALSSTPNYVFTDAQATLGTNFYRVKIVDKDGSSSYSKIVSAVLGSQAAFSVYPNPAKDKVTLQFMPAVGKGSVVIRSLAGNTLYNAPIDLQAGKAIIPIHHLAKGIYAVQLIINHKTQVQTLVVE